MSSHNTTTPPTNMNPSFYLKSQLTEHKTDMGQSCTDCVHKHCGHVQPVNIREEFATTPDKNLTSLHQTKTSMSFVSESNKTRKKCKRCPNPQCGVMQNSNVVKNCKTCKHKFVFENKNPNSRQGLSTKICPECGEQAKSGHSFACSNLKCNFRFSCSHKKLSPKTKKPKIIKKTSGKKRSSKKRSSKNSCNKSVKKSKKSPNKIRHKETKRARLFRQSSLDWNVKQSFDLSSDDYSTTFEEPFNGLPYVRLWFHRFDSDISPDWNPKVMSRQSSLDINQPERYGDIQYVVSDKDTQLDDKWIGHFDSRFEVRGKLEL